MRLKFSICIHVVWRLCALWTVSFQTPLLPHPERILRRLLQQTNATTTESDSSSSYKLMLCNFAKFLHWHLMNQLWSTRNYFSLMESQTAVKNLPGFDCSVEAVLTVPTNYVKTGESLRLKLINRDDTPNILHLHCCAILHFLLIRSRGFALRQGYFAVSQIQCWIKWNGL